MTEPERAASEIQNTMPKIENGVVVTSEDFENWTVSLMLNGKAIFTNTFNAQTDMDVLRLFLPLTRKATPWRRDPYISLHSKAVEKCFLLEQEVERLKKGRELLERELSETKDKLYRLQHKSETAEDAADRVF